MKSIKILLKSICLILFILSSHSFSDILNKIEINGNDRISDETIKLFIQVELKDEINDAKLNDILKDLYETDFFKNISVNFKDQILSINVQENPIIENIIYEGIKSNRILDIIKEESSIKSRSSYNEINIKKDKLKIGNILKNLGYYNSNIDTLVEENPIIENIIFEGIKSNRILDIIKEETSVKSRSSYNEIILKKDEIKIENVLKNLGYYNSNIETLVEQKKNNLVNITYNIDQGKKSKIKKITFIGNKIFKDKKLRRVISSNEYKFWKLISGRKYLNQSLVYFDERLLKNFYKNNGYYNAEINTSFAKMLDEHTVELIFNINAGPKITFGDLKLNLPSDFDENNFVSINKLFKKIKGKPYSINIIDKILEEIDQITALEQYKFIKANVVESIDQNLINLVFNVEEGEKIYVDKINIFGNSITAETVIRNQLLLDEGDPFSEILLNKSINNLKSLNFFKKVQSKLETNDEYKTKIINIFVEEKASGEIYASAGVGTSGGSFGFGIRENNFLGNGIKLDSNFNLSSSSFKGKFSIMNPNFNNSDKSLFVSAEASENDNFKTFGYKTNKTGVKIGTNFEYLNDFYLGIANSNFYEKIETNSTASAKQKKQEGNYWDSFVSFDMNYDKRNQKFQTNSGFKSFYSVDLPIISDTNTVKNYYNYSHYFELFEKNFSSMSIYLQSANSLNNKDVKLSERITIPSSRLRGFEAGRIGPKDGDDYIGGNYAYSINFASNIPQLFEESQNLDFLIFADAADIWGVDYDSSITGEGIRSSVGVAMDWMSPIGPLNFTLAYPIIKKTGDKTESFRFNLGTTF